MGKRHGVFPEVKLTLSSVLLLGVCAFFWLTLGQGESLVASPAPPPGSHKETYLSGAERWQYDALGDRNVTLTIDSGYKTVSSPVTHLQSLFVTGRDKEERRWEMTAQAGKLHPHSQELILSKGVKVEQVDAGATLTTPRLRLLLDEERAVTASRVRLVSDNSETTAKGMAIDLARGTAQLLSDVETRYED